jgi:hypothetical protein
MIGKSRRGFFFFFVWFAPRCCHKTFIYTAAGSGWGGGRRRHRRKRPSWLCPLWSDLFRIRTYPRPAGGRCHCPLLSFWSGSSHLSSTTRRSDPFPRCRITTPEEESPPTPPPRRQRRRNRGIAPYSEETDVAVDFAEWIGCAMSKGISDLGFRSEKLGYNMMQ